MATAVRLHVLTGPHRSTTYCVRDRTVCTVGRASECLIQLTGHERDNMVSRRHCLLHITLPEVQARDLGSRNGTFLNGKPIHCHQDAPHLDSTTDRGPSCATPVEDGDVLTLGGMSMRIALVECPLLEGDCAAAGGAEGEAWRAEVPVLRNCGFPCQGHV